MNARLEALTGLLLLHPELLSLALLLPVALLWPRRGSSRPAFDFAPSPLLKGVPGLTGEMPMPRSWRLRTRPIAAGLTLLGLLTLVFALARPVHRAELPREVQGIDILLCLDVSSSMADRDLDPRRTRLDLAIESAQRFIEGRPNDRIGLLTFARYPDLLSAPTLDHRSIREFLADVELVETDGPEDLTGIGTAVAQAAEVLAEGSSPSKVLIVLTDGVENVAAPGSVEEIHPLRAARLCEAVDVRAYTIAAGVGHRARDGSLTALDHRAIQRLAELTGGQFFEARHRGAISDIYQTIGALETNPLGTARFEVRERYLSFLIVGLLLLLVAQLLRSWLWEIAP